MVSRRWLGWTGFSVRSERFPNAALDSTLHVLQSKQCRWVTRSLVVNKVLQSNQSCGVTMSCGARKDRGLVLHYVGNR